MAAVMLAMVNVPSPDERDARYASSAKECYARRTMEIRGTASRARCLFVRSERDYFSGRGLCGLGAASVGALRPLRPSASSMTATVAGSQAITASATKVAKQVDGADGVVVGGDAVLDVVGVAVGVKGADHGDVQGAWPRG